MAKIKKIELPMEKYVELPHKVVADQIMSVFTEEVRQNYDIEYITEVNNKYVVKLLRHPMPSFTYRKENR